jgi:hypothetical protein
MNNPTYDLAQASTAHAKHSLPLWLHKLLNYEYWPWYGMYLFVIPYYLYLSVKSRSLVFFSNVNPSFEYSAFKNYSKFEVLKKLPPNYIPLSFLIKPFEIIKEEVILPCILKPDNGERGKGVSLIRSKDQFDEYLKSVDDNIIYQEFVDLPYEATVFYTKLPSEKVGRITSFTTKVFLRVIGDGQNTIEDLLLKDARGAMQLERISQNLKVYVPALGEVKIIEPIGNHCRGTQFINSNDLINVQLTETFEKIAQQIDGFHYGRFDLKYNSFEELQSGANFKIVELNGVSADPAHIFDQKTGFINSLKDIMYHWSIMSKISIENSKNGIKPTNIYSIIKLILQLK